MEFPNPLSGKQTDAGGTQTENITQDWASFFATVNGKRASIRLNLALHDLAPIEKLPYSVRISIALTEAETDFPKLYRIEDDMTTYLAKHGILQVGTITGGGYFDLYFYTPDSKQPEQLAGETMKNHPDYPYSVSCNRDETWRGYFDYLYPNDYEYQSILNAKVWLQLEQAGDIHHIPREIDHYLYFHSEHDRTLYIREVEKLGYKVLSAEQGDDGKTFRLNIARADVTELPQVNGYVWELIELARKHHGGYDGWGCPIMK